eukprot:NODE_4729_length_749_cov_18.842444_g4569_i0.p1 GENE.NODE_4729_length_749_cov_18.842444_g4569_i0~~NODE_4729_length_749_cov_18.842444_g4569_i0.p1  ORF type:complete len:241 (+),score=83.27 NODE_4729_length_749_cov_18.842444_g4569_i0:65-724(+)
MTDPSLLDGNTSDSDSTSSSSSSSDSSESAAPPAKQIKPVPINSPAPLKRVQGKGVDGEETLLQRCKRLRREKLINEANLEKAQADEARALAEGTGDPMKDYKPKRPPRMPFPADTAKLDHRIAQIAQQITTLKSEMRMKDDSKTVSLGTSKVNYIDPRIINAWCRRNEVPLEKVFAKTLIKKFPWALGASPDFRFDRRFDTSATNNADVDDGSGPDSD